VLGVPAAAAADGPVNTSLEPRGLSWVGIHALRQMQPRLRGEGVRLGVVCRSYTYDEDDKPLYDYRPNVEHSCLAAARLGFHDGSIAAGGASPHSTAICSILFGHDPDGAAAALEPFLYEGAVPDAEGSVYEFYHFSTEHVLAQHVPAVDVLAASFGHPFDKWWTRGLEVMVEDQGLLVVASIGNGMNAADPPLYPGAGPNAIGVGVVSSVNTGDLATKLSQFALAYPDRSSLGPTEDGRCKPDLIAPGNCLIAGTEGDKGYAMSGDWTSFSAPVTAGVAGLLVQAARQDRRLGSVLLPNGGSCVLKAILMNSAVKLPYWHKGRLSPDDDREVPLDYAQGAGMVNAVGAYQLLNAGRVRPAGVAAMGWDLNELDMDRTPQQVYRMVVDDPAGKVVTATLVWNRHYEQEYPFDRIEERDSNLRLELLGVDPEGAGAELLDCSDSPVDNVEHIHIETDPNYPLYELIVSYSDVDGRPSDAASEPYGVAWSVTEKGADESIFWHDLNADGIVDEADFGVLMTNLVEGLKSPDAYVIGDLNDDGLIDAKDVERLLERRDRRAAWHDASTVN
jgi:hypothetical protein